MWLSRHVDSATIIATDLPSLLPLTELNLQANHRLVAGKAATDRQTDGRTDGRSDLPPRLQIAPLRWGCAVDLQSGIVPRGADLVLAADVVYFAEDVPNVRQRASTHQR